MECSKCRRAFQKEDRVVAISGSIMGDEHTDCYFFCPVCQLYTVAKWWDNFTGVETENVTGPLSKQEGDTLVELIRKCEEPWDKKCRCEAHVAYFRGTLD